jgi:hypothetical protein
MFCPCVPTRNDADTAGLAGAAGCALEAATGAMFALAGGAAVATLGTGVGASGGRPAFSVRWMGNQAIGHRCRPPVQVAAPPPQDSSVASAVVPMPFLGFGPVESILLGVRQKPPV